MHELGIYRSVTLNRLTDIVEEERHGDHKYALFVVDAFGERRTDIVTIT